jgi:hypothetical protein
MASNEVVAHVVDRILDSGKGSVHMRAAGNAGAISVRILAETARTVLLPFAALNYGVRKFEGYIRDKFPGEFTAATAHIPEESIQEPPLNVAGPVMQGLTYSYESDELRAMFLALLATSMDSTRSDSAHPAFADIIRQLDPKEAPILAALLKSGDGRDVVRYSKSIKEPRGIYLLLNHVLPLYADDDVIGDTRASYRQIASYVDNWIRLGLVSVDYEHPFSSPSRYQWVEDWPSTVAMRADYGDELVVTHGSLTLTAWGEEFSLAIRESLADSSGYVFNHEEDESSKEQDDVLGTPVLDGGAP